MGTPKSNADRDRQLRLVALERFAEFSGWPAERDAAKTFIATIESAKTASTYASSVVQFFRWCADNGVSPYGVKPSQAKIYLAELSYLAPNTRAGRCTAARSFYNHVLGDDDRPIDRNPFDRVHPKHARPRRVTPALDRETFEELLGKLRGRIAEHPERLIGHRDFAMIYLLGRLGPRSITTAHLVFASFRAEAGSWRVALRLKGDRTEEIEIPDDVLAVLGHWSAVLTGAIGRDLRPDDAVFPPLGPYARKLSGGGTLLPLSEDGISYIVKRRLRTIGVVGAGWAAHVMRASAITIAVENGASVEEAQAMACHLNRSQTDAYVRRRTTPSAARRWTPAIPPLPGADAGPPQVRPAADPFRPAA
jgi:site-specific recombinase XerD